MEAIREYLNNMFLNLPETPQVLHLNDTSNRTVSGLAGSESHLEWSTFFMEMDVTSPVCPAVPQK